MVFIGDKLCLDNTIDVAEDNNQDRVDDTQAVLDIPRCLLTYFFVSGSDFFTYQRDKHLTSEDKTHEEETDWHTDEQLCKVTVLHRNLLLDEGVRVDGHLTFELRALLCDIFIAPDKPLIRDIVLFSLPAFMEHGHPDHDDQRVKYADGRCQDRFPVAFLLD